MIVAYVILTVTCLFFGFFFIGEWLTNKLPSTFFAKWWRKNVIEECQDCD